MKKLFTYVRYDIVSWITTCKNYWNSICWIMHWIHIQSIDFVKAIWHTNKLIRRNFITPYSNARLYHTLHIKFGLLTNLQKKSHFFGWFVINGVVSRFIGVVDVIWVTSSQKSSFGITCMSHLFSEYALDFHSRRTEPRDSMPYLLREHFTCTYSIKINWVCEFRLSDLVVIFLPRFFLPASTDLIIHESILAM